MVFDIKQPLERKRKGVLTQAKSMVFQVAYLHINPLQVYISTQSTQEEFLP